MSEGSVGLSVVLGALETHVDQLANQALDRFARDLPDARSWSTDQQAHFVDQARGRFRAILAVARENGPVDDSLRRDLYEVGSHAARADSSLPHVLLVLRISRDLIVQAAHRLGREHRGEWDDAVEACAARVSQVIDRLSDALSDGFWRTLLEDRRRDWHRLSSVIERAPYGVYEADMDGRIQFANAAMADIVGLPGRNLEGVPLSDVVRPLEPISSARLLAEPVDDVNQHGFTIQTESGERRTLEIDTVVRREDGVAVGFAGIVRLVR